MARQVAPNDPLRPLRVLDSRGEDRGDWASQRLVWIPDQREGFVAARVKSESGDTAVCAREDNKTEVTLPKGDIQLMNPPKFSKSEDMASLTNLNEASVLFNLKERYSDRLIYTFSGLFCVVINPYTSLPIYTDAVIQAYKGQKRENVPPHVYAIADEAYRNMVQGSNNTNQSILCTGESGAGKTENTKKIIQYLTTVASSGRKQEARAAGRSHSSVAMLARTEQLPGKGELEEQLLQCNPILETFGNAATIKNDNSSRFGKFIRIRFDASGYIVGGNIDVYLLEKSRTVRQNENERNFHSFYQLLSGGAADPKLAKDLLLEGITNYRFMSNGDFKLNGVNDQLEFKTTNDALQIMGLTPAEITSVWRTVSATLHFGQIEVDQGRRADDQAKLKSDTPVQKLCSLLGIPPNSFSDGLLHPKMDMGSESVARAQDRTQVLFSLEALAKGLYERLFLWLVFKINQTLGSNSRDSKTFIGLLDIAGFEIFKTNSFEQLCINLTNEKLQQLFNRRMFIMEQKEYKDEEIAWTPIDFGLDLEPTINLIEQNPGIFAILDDQAIFPKATDKSILEMFVQKLGQHPKFTPPKPGQDGIFIIEHYAGAVTYTTRDWLVKNKDPLNTSLTALLERSTDPFIQRLWSTNAALVPMTTSLRGRGVMRTVSHIYKEQLEALMQTLDATNPHFVRCIIPNHVKQAGVLNCPLVLDQLRCNGVLEGIRICRLGFPNRIPFAEFRQRYKLLTPEVVQGFRDSKDVSVDMVKALGLNESQFRIGKTKIFFRAGALHELEERRDLTLSRMIVGLQAHCRGFLVRRPLRRISPDAVKIIQRNIRAFMRIRSWHWWRLYTKIKPLIPTMSADQKLRDLQAEIDRLTKLHEADEKRIRELEEAQRLLEEDKHRMGEQLKIAEQTLMDAEDKITRLTIRKTEVEDEMTKLETELDEQMTISHGLLQESKNYKTEVEQLRENLKANDAAEARINQLTAEIKDWRSRLDNSVVELHAATEKSARLQKEIGTKQEELDNASAAKSRAEKARAKAQSELDDANVQLTEVRSSITQQQTKFKSQEKQVNEASAKQKQTEGELEKAQADLREAQTKNLIQRNELADLEVRATTAEQAKRKLETELEEMIGAQNERNVADLERMRRDLQSQVDEQKKQILELEDEVQLSNDARMRSEVTVVNQKKEIEDLRKSAEDAVLTDSLETKIKGLQRQVAELQQESDSERRLRGQISNEKRRLDLELTTVREQVDEERASRTREQRLREQSEARLREVMAGVAGGAIGASDARELERCRKNLKQSLATIAELDDLKTKAESGQRRAERELVEQRELVETYQEDITQLRGQLRRIMTSLSSGEHGSVSMHWTTTSTVRSGTGEVTSSQTESGSGVPPTLRDSSSS